MLRLPLGVAVAVSITAACVTAPSRSTVPSPIVTMPQLRVAFEPNLGQTVDGIDFVARPGGYTLLLSADEAVFLPGAGTPAGARPRVLRMRLQGARADAEALSLDQLDGKVNYLRGANPDRWHTNVPTFAKVLYRDVYEGIDLVYYGRGSELEYDFVARPGADIAAIGLVFDGADRVEITDQGELLLHSALGQFRHRKPQVYQEIGGRRRPVDGRYRVDGSGIRFQVGTYDSTIPLVIDPTLEYSTFYGPANPTAVVIDASGSVYMTGGAGDTLPTTPGAFDTTGDPNASEAFVMKLNPTGSALEYSTYLGGNSSTSATAIAIDAAGNAYVTGTTMSSDFPVTPGAFDTTRNDQFDAFLVKLNPSGSALVYATYLGGTRPDYGIGVGVDGSGRAYVLGRTESRDFPTTRSAFDETFNGVEDAFVLKMDAAGAALVYSTYLGGSGNESPSELRVDSAGSAYVIGYTPSTDFPTTPGAQQTVNAGSLDAFIVKLNASGSVLDYSTYFGGSDAEHGHAIYIDGPGNAYITGQTRSTDLPITAGAFDTSHNGGSFDRFDAYIGKLDASGRLLYSTFVGGSESDYGKAIVADDAGNAYVAGRTSSRDFPTHRALQAAHGGGGTPQTGDYTAHDAFVIKLDASGATALYSTYLGGSHQDYGEAIAVDAMQNAIVVGPTQSAEFPATPNAYDTTRNGVMDAFIAKIVDQDVNPTSAPPARRAGRR